MRTNFLVRTSCILVLAATAVACRDNNTTPDDTNAPVDSTTQDIVTNPTDTTNPVDVVRPDGTVPTDATTDVRTGATVTIAQLANPAATGHPTPPQAGIPVVVTDSLVALSPRLVSGPSAAGNCSYSAWVGTSAGGAFSAMEVFESEPATTVDGGPSCPFDGTALIPATLVVGDVVTHIAGRFEIHCGTGDICPMNVAPQIFMQTSHGELFTVPTPGVGGGVLPPPTVVSITDIAPPVSAQVDGGATGTAMGTRSIELQNTVVTVADSFLNDLPTSANHNVITVSETSGQATTLLNVAISNFPYASCARTALTALGANGHVGSVTGILSFPFDRWQLQLRGPGDLPTAAATCGADGGVADGGSTDASADGN